MQPIWAYKNLFHPWPIHLVIFDGFTYTFIVTFFFQPSGGTELPVGFVVKIASTEGGSLALFWEESEVVTSNGNLSPDISASMSTGNIPNLDADGDGYDNFSEFREGSDPMDPNDVPLPPEMVGAPEIIHQEDYVEFNVTFKDASGISKIAPVGTYICGYYEWTLTDVTPDGKTKQLHAMFNLHAWANLGTEIIFNIQATDVLGLSQTYDVKVTPIGKNDLSEDDPLNKPEIAIITPSAGETVSDFVNIKAEACYENGITTLSVQGLGVVPDSNSDAAIFEGTLDTTGLGDGPQNITLGATGTGNKTNQRAVQVIIANQNPIKIDAPQPGSTLVDGFPIAAHVDKGLMPSVANLYVESITDEAGNEIYSFNQLKFDVNSLPEAFTGQIFDTSQETNRIFIVTYVAVGSDGRRESREVKYKINNYPEVLSFEVLGSGAKACLQGSDVTVQWSVDNIGTNGKVIVGGENKGPLEEGTTTLASCNVSILLEATRYGWDYSNNSVKEYLTATPLPLSIIKVKEPSVGTPPDEFKIVFEVDPLSAPMNDLSPLKWWVKLTSETGSSSGNASGGSIEGNEFPGGLQPRTDYEMELTLVNGAGGTISGPITVDFTTGDEGLVGWWRFLTDGADFSGNGNNLSLYGISIDPASGAVFDGTGSGSTSSVGAEIAYRQDDIHGSSTGLTLEGLIRVDELRDTPFLIAKDGEYALGILPGGKLQAILGLNTDCSVSFSSGNPLLEFYQSASTLNLGWHHVVVTFNGSSDPKKVLFYIDGVKDTAEFSPDQNLDNICNTTPFAINLLAGIGSAYYGNFKGIVGEAAIYNRPLSGSGPNSEIYKSCQRLGVCP